MSGAFPLPHPYISGEHQPDSFEDRTQQNFDALAIAIGNLSAVDRSVLPACQVVASAVPVASGVLATVQFSAAQIDTAGMFTSAAPTVVTVKKPGLYAATASVGWAWNLTGYRAAAVRWRRGAAWADMPRVLMSGGDDGRAAGTPFALWPCEPGDTFELNVSHNAGVSLNIEVATLTVVRLGNT